MKWLACVVVLAACDGVLHFEKVSAIDASDDAPADAADDPLVAHYEFDDVSGVPCAIDTAGHHDGTCTGTPAAVPGPNAAYGNALFFDGATYVITGHAVVLDPTTGFTVALWVQPGMYPDTVTYECPISRPYGTAFADSWQICMTGGLSYFLFGGTSATYAMVPDATWTHLAMTWDATTATATAYIAGASVGTISNGQPPFDAQGLWMGADRANLGVDAVYTGAIDDVRIYRRALSATEVAALAAGGQ